MLKKEGRETISCKGAQKWNSRENSLAEMTLSENNTDHWNNNHAVKT